MSTNFNTNPQFPGFLLNSHERALLPPLKMRMRRLKTAQITIITTPRFDNSVPIIPPYTRRPNQLPDTKQKKYHK